MDVEAKYAELLRKIGKTSMGKRPRTVVMHMLEYGFITTEILRKTYGYEHTPRAIRDARDLGIPIKTTNVKNEEGKTVAKYEFATKDEYMQFSCRLPFSKEFKDKVSSTGKCALCAISLDKRYLQIDHRVPFTVFGDDTDMEPANFMLLCGSCNRSKSWSCENCTNWKKDRNPGTCGTCYWACPARYEHVAMMDIRRLDMTWQGDEVPDYEALLRTAEKAGLALPKYIKQELSRRP